MPQTTPKSKSIGMNSEKKPLVSVVMATYNRAPVILKTIENIFEQDYRPLELIVINDGSSDSTFSILKYLQKTFNFTIVDNPKNMGLQKSLNRGIEKATGKYIARIDDHDEWLKNDKLSKQVDFLEKNPEFGMIGTAYRVGKNSMQNPLTDSEIRKQILLRSPFCHVTVMMRKSTLQSVGGYDETLPYSEDWDLWLKIGTKTKFANFPDVTVAVTEEEASLSDDYFLKQLPINRQVVSRYLKNYSGGWKASLYHRFIQVFFAIVPLNGKIHRFMQGLFRKRFLS